MKKKFLIGLLLISGFVVAFEGCIATIYETDRITLPPLVSKSKSASPDVSADNLKKNKKNQHVTTHKKKNTTPKEENRNDGNSKYCEEKVYTNGDRYIGETDQNGVPNGIGKYYEKGAVYEGRFVDGKLEG